MKIKRSVIAFILLIFFFLSSGVQAQRKYFNSAVTSGFLTSSDGTLAGGDYRANLVTLLGSSSNVEFKYTTTPFLAGSTTFFKVTLNSLSDLKIEVSMNGTAVPNTETHLVTNKNDTYLAVTPGANYNVVRITLNPQLANSAVIYNGFNGHQIDCGAGWVTSDTRVSNSGVAIDATSKVNNGTNAVDGSPGSYSLIYLKGQQRNVVISQTIYFSTAGNPTDVLRLYLSETPGYSRSSSGATAQAFMQSTAVTAAIDLFPSVPQSGTMVPVEISPGAAFDRVVISITSSSNGNQNYGLNVHEVQILPTKPVLSFASTEFCENVPENISVSNPVSGLQYNWYDGATPITNPESVSYSPTQLPVGSHVLNVTASRPGCPESTPASVTVHINPKPITPAINPIN